MKEVKHSAKAKSNLKHLLILLSRILIITSLVLAFSQPFIPVKQNIVASINTPSSIFIDNSFSTENNNVDGRISDIIKELGFQLVDQLPAHINHQLITNNFTGAEQRHFSATEITNSIQNITTSPNSKFLSEIMKRQKSAFDNNQFTSYIISDFQKTQFDFNNLNNDTIINYTLIPVTPAEVNNVSIDSMWFNTPVHRLNKEEKVYFRLHNHNPTETSDLRVSLTIDSAQISFAQVQIPASSILDTFLTYSSNKVGWHQGLLEIDDSPILFDNKLYFNFHIMEHVNVLSINSDKSLNLISKAFEIESYFHFNEMNQSSINFDQLDNSNLLILNEVTEFSSGLIFSITKFVNNGGNLLVIPSPINSSSLNELLNNLEVSSIAKENKDSTSVDFINLNSPLFSEMFTSTKKKINLPKIFSHFELSGNFRNSGTELLKTTNHHRILTKWNKRNGKIYLLAIPLQPEYSNFGLHSIFLPTLYEIAFNSTQSYNPYLTINYNDFITIPLKSDNHDLYHIIDFDQTIDVIPEIYPQNNGTRLNFHKSILTSGNYKLLLSDSLIGYLSFNYAHIESNPACYSSIELNNIIDSLGLSNFEIMMGSVDSFSNDFKKQNSGIELWYLFVIATLLFLATEIILIRYFKPSVI